jgi:hypothetical protein
VCFTDTHYETRSHRKQRVPSFSSAQAWRYSAHELGAIDLIARERLRSCRDDVAWGDLWPSFDRRRFGLRSVVNAAEPLPAFANEPAHTGFSPIGPYLQHDGARGHCDGGHIANKKGGPKAAPSSVDLKRRKAPRSPNYAGPNSRPSTGRKMSARLRRSNTRAAWFVSQQRRS